MASDVPSTIQRSPLRPLTPRRRSLDHGALHGSLEECPADKIAFSCAHHDDGTFLPQSSGVADVDDTGHSINVDGIKRSHLEQQVRQVLLENARLKNELESRSGDDVMTQQLLHQLQTAMADKSKIIQENDELARENCDLRMLLAYCAGEGGIDP